MKAINWLRSKQEENELGYWLSFAAYDQSDRSLINKAYLLYLVIFLFIWLMMMLFFFAKYGGMVLAFLNPAQAANTSMTIEWIVLACWNLFGLFQSARRSPIVFSETDQALVCQTPASRRALVMRWLLMPWIKSALPFWLMSLVLGFSTAELHFAADAANAIFNYVGFGLRALILIVPIHLALYLFQWVVGVFRLHTNKQRDWIIYPALLSGLIPLVFAVVNNFTSQKFIASPLQFFMDPNYINGKTSASLPFGLGLAVFLLGLLFWVSHHFNLNRAAQETSELELMATATRYGFTDLADQRRLQNRLSSKRKITLTHRHQGSAVILWKNQIQTLRGWTWKQTLPLIGIFGISVGLPMLPGFMSKLLALFFLVFQMGPLLTPRLRSDLACWPIMQQLPIQKTKLMLYDLISNLPILLAICVLGLGFSSVFSHFFSLSLLIILPGLLAIIGFTAAIDIFRKSKSDLLVNGNVPSVGTQGVILGVVGAIIPVFLATSLTGSIGMLLSLVFSLIIAWICYKFAIYSFKSIKT